MRPNIALVLATAVTASAQQQKYDTFEECQAACTVSAGCRSAAYSAVSKECNTYTCILSQIFEPPAGIQIYRPSGNPNYTICPNTIPLPATTVAVDPTGTTTSPTGTNSTASDIDATATADNNGDCDNEVVSVTFTKTICNCDSESTDTPSYSEGSGNSTTTPTSGGGSLDQLGSSSGTSGDCLPGPGCGDGNGNETIPYNSGSVLTSTVTGISDITAPPEPTSTFVSVSGVEKMVVAGLLPALGLVVAMLC